MTLNLSYITGYISTTSGNWSSGATWLGGNAPSTGYLVVVNNTVTLDANKTIDTSNVVN